MSENTAKTTDPIWDSRNSDEPKSIAETLQSEYDMHYSKYRRGCHGCIVSARAIAEVAKRLGFPVKEFGQ